MDSMLVYLQYQALFLWLVLATGWCVSGLNRRRERLRRVALAATADDGDPRPPLPTPHLACDSTITASTQAEAAAAGAVQRGGGAVAAAAAVGDVAAANDPAAATTASAASLRLPPVSVVLPVKGCRPHSLENWESHLGLQYDGPLEFVFVVESGDDPAVPALQLLQRRHGSRVAVRLVVAGLATSCSQKVHNLVAGVECCDPRVGRTPGGGYVLCLDDDVELHPGTLRELVGELEGHPERWMATGYPFDAPPPGSSFPAYLALCYHLPLLIAFSVNPDTSFVWGGCMLLRGPELLPDDPLGLLAAWRQGGYSDDLILASFCTERRLSIRVPPFAVFPQRLDPNMTWRSWINYLHRQLFVLDTYTNDHNRRTNHTMMVVHSVLSCLLVLPSLAALATCANRVVAIATTVFGFAAIQTNGGHSTTLVAELPGGGGAVAATEILPGSVWAVLVGWSAAHVALVFMTGEILGLFRQLSPFARPILLSWYRWERLWAAMLLSNIVLPLLVAYTYISPQVDWGGIVYRKQRGRVTPVRRLAEPNPAASTDDVGSAPKKAR